LWQLSVIAVDEARQHLADQIVKHTHKAKKIRVDEAVASTEVTLSKIIAVNAVELLSNFPADLWKQLHSARTQVCNWLALLGSLAMYCDGVGKALLPLQ
jgi:hypothetical protein